MKDLIPNKYYLFSIEAINDYSTTNIFSSMIQLSSLLFINSGIGCNQIQLQYNHPMKQMTESLVIYKMNKINYPVLLSKLVLSPINFFCFSDPIQVLIKCTWDYKEYQGILGFIVSQATVFCLKKNFFLTIDLMTYSVYRRPVNHVPIYIR